MSAVSRIPQICKHKATNQAVVRLNGHDYYLGRFGSAASKQSYEKLIAEWLANGRQLPDMTANLSVNKLILAYWHRCEQHYRMPDGNPSSELGLVRLAMRPLKLLYGKSAAHEFGPMALKTVRNQFVANGLSRGVVNAHVGRIKRMFRWAVENELVPPSIYHGLQAVAGLQHGRSEARETEPVRPAPDHLIDAALAWSPRPVAAMAKLQLLTGMRPGEACIMRACDLDTRGHVWVYTPSSHKTAHHGHHRQIYLGPKAQALLRSWLRTDLQAYLFSPIDSEAERNLERRRNRQTPMTPSQANRTPCSRPKRQKRERYDVDSYRRSIARACDLAFPPPPFLGQLEGETHTKWQARLTPSQKVELAAWRNAHRWHPHQLRHNAATNLRRQHGVELARIVLGHSTAFTTEIYAEADQAQAIEIMAKIG